MAQKRGEALRDQRASTNQLSRFDEQRSPFVLHILRIRPSLMHRSYLPRRWSPTLPTLNRNHAPLSRSLQSTTSAPITFAMPYTMAETCTALLVPMPYTNNCLRNNDRCYRTANPRRARCSEHTTNDEHSLFNATLLYIPYDRFSLPILIVVDQVRSLHSILCTFFKLP